MNELVQELKTLRKGRSLFGGRIEERIGPALRAVAGVLEGDGPVAMRQKVMARLAALAEQLPEDLRVAALAAFAITPEARRPLYQERVAWAAVKVDRDARTVRRRVDEAITMLAEQALDAFAPSAEASAGWHTTELKVAVALDRARPEILEQRRIVADQDGVRSLDLAVSLPGGGSALEVDVLYGGTVVDCGLEASDRRGFALTLPKPLARGESHDFAVQFRLPSASAMKPYMVCVPRHPCEQFELRVRFGRDRPPRVWMLQGAFQQDVADPLYVGRECPVDPAGEVCLHFHRLAPGLVFGARWEAEEGFGVADAAC